MSWASLLREDGSPRQYAHDQALMYVDQVPSEVLVLLDGWVKVSATTPAGKTVLLALRGPGELVGELSALDEAPRSASIVAIEPVQALAVPHARFRKYLLEHPEAALTLLQELGGAPAQRRRQARPARRLLDARACRVLPARAVRSLR